MKGNPPSAELQVMQLVFHFTSKEKQPDVQLYIISCVLGKWFDWTVRDLKENNWKVDYAETGERGMWKYFSEWVRICEDICLCLIRVWPQQRTVLIIKQIGWLVCGSVNIFPQPLLFFQWAHEQNSHGGRWGMVSATWTSIHQGWTDYSHYWVLNQAGEENNIEHLLWHHSPGEGASYQICRLSTLDCFHHGRENLTGIDMYSGYRFAFPTCNSSANSAIHLHIECTALSTAFHK